MQAIKCATPVRLRFVEAGDPSRPKLERHIHARYARAYGADVRHFLPTLIGLETTDDRVVGAMGLCSAARQPLFLEQYLDNSVEAVLGARLGRELERGTIVELGNLAAGSPGAARWMIIALNAYLCGAGFRWVVFTAVPALRNAFRRLGIKLEELQPADGNRLGADKARWGSYYDHCPVVVAADVRRSFVTLRCALEMEQAMAVFRGLWEHALHQGARVGRAA